MGPRRNHHGLVQAVHVTAGGVEQGEDWSERLASEVAHLLGVPAARVDLAHRDGRRGLISYDVRQNDPSTHAFDLWSGADLLSSHKSSYNPGRHDPPGRPGHSLGAIAAALDQYRAPPELRLPKTASAMTAFSGYLVLDALIANQDRHDENWAVLRGASSDQAALDCLAPSFDHASSLGFNLRDERRERELDRGVETWARRGAATRFEHQAPSKPKTLVALATDLLHMIDRPHRDWWLSQVEDLDLTVIAARAARIPSMSDPARTFAVALIDTNRRRLLDECHRACTF